MPDHIEPPTERDLYDLLRAVVTRTPWRSEAERDQWLGLVERIDEINLFGYLSTTITVKGKQ